MGLDFFDTISVYSNFRRAKRNAIFSLNQLYGGKFDKNNIASWKEIILRTDLKAKFEEKKMRLRLTFMQK